jgi:hypothetical protein
MYRFRTLLQTLCFTSVVAALASCGPTTKPQDTVQLYFEALQRSDFMVAHSLLGEDDQTYFDLTRFKTFLQQQPYTQFLFGGNDLGENHVGLGSLMDYEILETTPVPSSVEVIVKVSVPDVAKILGETLAQRYFFGDEVVPQGVRDSLELSKRLSRNLNALSQPDAPRFVSYQRLVLKKYRQQWVIDAPAWRVEAMVKEAKEELVLKNTKQAQVLLETASDYVTKVDDLTRQTFVRDAIAGKHMLQYLPQVTLSAFRLGAASPRCSHPAALSVTNGGERPLRTVDVVVRFMKQPTQLKVKEEVAGNQVVSFDKSFKQNAATFLTAGETLELDLCLQPPPYWNNLAETHLSWLEFAK